MQYFRSKSVNPAIKNNNTIALTKINLISYLKKEKINPENKLWRQAGEKKIKKN